MTPQRRRGGRGSAPLTAVGGAGPRDADPRGRSRGAGAPRRAQRRSNACRPARRDGRDRWEWWDIGAGALVSRETKVALLAAMRLPAATQAQALESLDRLVDERELRALPLLAGRAEGESLIAPLRSNFDALAQCDRILCEDGRKSRCPPGEARAARLTDGRRCRGALALPPLPIGRHVSTAGVSCFGSPSRRPRPISRRRAPPRVRRRSSSMRSADRAIRGSAIFLLWGASARAAGAAGTATLGLNPLHALFPRSANAQSLSPVRPALSRSDPYRCARRGVFAERCRLRRARLDAGARSPSCSGRHGRLWPRLAL